MKDHNEHKLRKAWSDAERLIFLDKFLQYPKDFHRISAFIANKNTRDCVAYYYATKKSIPYKHLLAEQLQRRRGKMSWYVMKETLKVLNIADVSEEDLGAQCTYRSSVIYSSYLLTESVENKIVKSPHLIKKKGGDLHCLVKYSRVSNIYSTILNSSFALEHRYGHGLS